MKIRFYFNKNNLGILAVALVFAAVLCFQIGLPIWAFAGFGVCYFLIKSMKIETSPKLPGLFTGLMLLAGSFFTAYQVQYLLLDAELRAKISDSKMTLNVLCALTVFLAVQTFTNSAGLTCIISHITLMLLAAVNYFVYLFRGNEFIFSDIKSIQTGLSVAGNYEFVLDARAGYVILLSTLYVAFCRKIHVSFKRKVPIGVLAMSLAILCGAYVGQKTQTFVTETWEQKGSYRNGYLLNFMLSVRDSFIAAPDGYSAEAVQELEKIYGTDTPDNDGKKKPTVIAIMSESYADLGVIGDFSTNIDVTPFYDSLTENTQKGYALSSVFGAKTPNSEWEFLTGNSMAFLPGGSVVYQQYMTDTPNSLVSDMKNMGYTCVAMHPYYETGWSRNRIYPNMGFDEMYFLDDFDPNAMLRRYISDQEFYEKIIARYENRKQNEDLFLMGISMQNHGGYTEKYDNFTEPVRMLGVQYPDVNQYLSLVNESDRALEYLISYFKNVDEPVEIIFFGDHQPSLSSSFYPYLNGKGLSGLTLSELEALYTVPFFIWTNYESEAEEVPLTSLNYLGALALERADLALPAYRKFQMDMMQSIPAVNSRGYYSASQEKFLHVEDAAGEDAQWLEKYQILQYNNMFDRKEKSEVFFSYIK